MKIKELEELLPVTRANIRYYEKEGLLKPHRGKNGYRDYDAEDVERLKQILIFRKLGISILDIKRILFDGVPASQVVKRNMKLLAKQLDELNAAMEVSRAMADDVSVDSAFPTEKYWEMINTREQAGGSFYAYLNDYAAFSGRLFMQMWGSVFFYDMESRVKKSGWKLALLVILGLCVWRGFMQKSVFHVNSFWGAFLYPLFLFVLLSLCVLPPYLIDCLYSKKHGGGQPKAEAAEESPDSGDAPNDGNRQSLQASSCQAPSKKTPALLGFLKLVCGFLWFVFLLFIIPMRFGDMLIMKQCRSNLNYLINYKGYLVYMIAALGLFCMTLWLYGKYGILGNPFMKEAGMKSPLPKKMKHITFLASVAVFMLFFAVYCTWYDYVDDNGIICRRLFSYKEYSWSEVSAYRLIPGFDGTLTYTVRLQDGTNVALWGSSAGGGDYDEKLYPEGEDDYMLHLTRMFVELGIPPEVDWEKLDKGLSYDYWKDYAAKLRAVIEE